MALIAIVTELKMPKPLKPKSYKKVLVYDKNGEIKALLAEVAKIVASKSSEVGLQKKAEDVTYSESIKFLYEYYVRTQQNMDGGRRDEIDTLAE